MPIRGATVLPQAPAFNPKSKTDGSLCFNFGGMIYADGYEAYAISDKELANPKLIDGREIVLRKGLSARSSVSE